MNLQFRPSIFKLFERVRGEKRALRVATHDGVFHPDEALVLAMLKYFCDRYGIDMTVRRTRDEKIIEGADIAVDVGMKYDAENHRYDHHQKGGAGRRKPREEGRVGVSYSSIGLFWLHHGEDFCRMVLPERSAVRIPESMISTIAKTVDRTLIEGTCVIDTGDRKVVSGDVNVPMLASVMAMLNPVQISKGDYRELQLNALHGSMWFLQEGIIGAIMRAADGLHNRPNVGQILKKTQGAKDPRVLILSNESQAWRRMVGHDSPILVVIQPQMDERQTWAAIATTEGGLAKFAFPEDWCGARQKELRNLSGIDTSIFCHDKGFFASAETKDGAVAMVEFALKAWDTIEAAKEADRLDEEEQAQKTAAANSQS